MKRSIVVLAVMLSWLSLFAQTAKLPYPVIFLHGLVSSDATWTQAAAALGGGAKVFDVCLNHDGSTATASLTGSDIFIVGWRDGTTTPSPNRLYIMNFDQTRFSASGHSTHLQSNQSAIFKQGVALKAMIQAVLDIEKSDKVMLIGHSMGGLEAREYLQRGFDGTPTGRGTNWVDQTSGEGHKVARLVTTGTPHLGSNATGAFLAAFAGIDEKSEACRDLRYPYSVGSPIPVIVPAPHLFGGQETMFQWSSTPYNKDVNCNGTTGDQITGLNSGTTFNSSMPLPLNIRYTWITSDFNNSGQDMLVETPRQWLCSGTTPAPPSADTLLLAINHIDEPNDVASLIRGMDEPDDTSFAYQISIGQSVKGFITHGMNWKAPDKDIFRLQPATSGSLTVSLTGSGSGIDSFAVFSSSIQLQKKNAGDGTTTIAVTNVSGGNTYSVHVWGSATESTYLHPYTMTTSLAPTHVEGTETDVVNSFELHQNYPNPFNPITVIHYSIGAPGNVVLKIYDILGRELVTLVNEAKAPGRYSAVFNASALANGAYFYRMDAGGYLKVKRLTVMK